MPLYTPPTLKSLVEAMPSGETLDLVTDSLGATLNVPLSANNNTQHSWDFQVGGSSIYKCFATGDGAGGAQDKTHEFIGTAIFYGDFVVSAAIGGTGSIFAVDVSCGGRFRRTSKATVVAANDLTLGSTNFNQVTGNTTINGISTTNFYPGDEVTLEFSGTPTIKNNTAASGGYASIKLDGNADFSATANDTLTLILNYDGTYWLEKSRAILT